MEIDNEKKNDLINDELSINNKQNQSENNLTETNDELLHNDSLSDSSTVEQMNKMKQFNSSPKDNNVPVKPKVRPLHHTRSNSLSSPIKRELPPLPVNGEKNRNSLNSIRSEKKKENINVKTNFSSAPKHDFLRSSSPTKRPLMRFGMRSSSSSFSVKPKTPLPPIPVNTNSSDSQKNIPLTLLQPLPVQLEEEKRRLEDEISHPEEDKIESEDNIIKEEEEEEEEAEEKDNNIVLPPPPPPLKIDDNLNIISKVEENKMEDKEENDKGNDNYNEESKPKEEIEDKENKDDEFNNKPQSNNQQQNKRILNKLGNRWVINQQVNIQPPVDEEDDDWEDKLKLELERKWKESAGSEGPIMFTTIRQTIKKIWVRPLEKLPLHTDLPRLVNGLEIVDETSGTMLFKEDGTFDGTVRVREMLRVLITETEDEKTSDEVISIFNQYKNYDNDVIVLLDRFFKNGCKVYEEKGALWIKILKCIHQGIIFPVVFHMKKLFTDKYQYKDVKGSWKVRISIFDGAVEVEHRKGEKSYGSDADSNFSFQWLLTMRIDLNYQDIESNISIINYVLDQEMNKDIQSELRSIMRPFLHGAAQYVTIWRRPLRKLNVHRDFPRLCQRLSIFKSNGKPIFTRQPNQSNDVIVKEVLLQLCQHLSPELHPKLEYFLERYIKPTGDISEQFLKVLEENIITDDSKIGSILKCINTSIMYPAIDLLNKSIYDKLHYKDVRGTWSVHITLGPFVRGRGVSSAPTLGKIEKDLFIEPLHLIESSRNENIATPNQSANDNNLQYRYINIVHRKCEQSHSQDPKDYFMFEWMVAITLNRELTNIKDVYFGIIDFNFGPHTSEETKSTLLEHIKPFLRPPSLLNAAVSLDSYKLIDAAIQKIELLERDQHLINVYQKNLPHSVPLSLLLKSLRSKLPEGLSVKIIKD